MRGSQRVGMSTKKDAARPFGLGIFLWRRSQNEDRNEQRQGITMTVVSCLLCYMARLRVIAAHVRTWRACTPLARCNTLDFVSKSVCQGA